MALSVILADRGRWKEELVNDFEHSIFEAYPEIKAIKNGLYDQGAFYSSMSGSGSTVFALFDEEPEVVTKEGSHFHFKAEL